MYEFSSAERSRPGVYLTLNENDRCFCFSNNYSPYKGQAFLFWGLPVALTLADVEDFLTKNHRNKALKLLHKSFLFEKNEDEDAPTELHFFATRTKQQPAKVLIDRSLITSYICYTPTKHNEVLAQAEKTSGLPKVSGMFKTQFTYKESVAFDQTLLITVDFMVWLHRGHLVDVALFYASDEFKDENKNLSEETSVPKRKTTERKPKVPAMPKPRVTTPEPVNWPEYNRIESAPIDGSVKRCVVNGVRYLLINHMGHGRYKWEKFGTRGRPAGSKDKHPRATRLKKEVGTNASP